MIKNKLMPGMIMAAALLAAVLYLTIPAPGAVPVLSYHRIADEEDVYCVSPNEFDAQMAWLEQNGYSAISLTEMLDAFDGKRSLPARPIVITFDDGYQDNLTAALPIMEKHHMKGTIFLISSQVSLKGYLTWTELPVMYKRHTEFGAHTVTHTPLLTLPPDKQEWEVRESLRSIIQGLGEPVEFFAYPYGSYNHQIVNFIRQAGYRGAVSGVPGLNLPTTDRFQLKRNTIPRSRLGLWDFRLRLWRANVYARLGI